MGKQTVVHPYSRILFTNKRKETIKPQQKHEETLNAYSKVREANLKELRTV